MRVLKELLLPEVDRDKCTLCRLCVKCCPGYAVDFGDLNDRIFAKYPGDRELGNYLGCYLGHSNVEEIRRESSSGGVVTQLLVFALERGMIDGALVTRMKKNDPLEPESFIARTREEVISASKTKYCPTSPNEALRCILREEGKFAVVGLPCHIHGVRKAEENMKVLKEKIVLHFGLICSHNVNFSGTEFLLKKLGISREQVAEIAYRGQGWPGSLVIKLKSSLSVRVPYVGTWNSYWPVFSCCFFTPMRCLMCPDETNELSDVSLGDAWLPELRRERDGESVVVSRTLNGEKILSLASSAGVVFLKPITCERVKQTQAGPLRFKKDDIGYRLALLEASDHKTPEFSPRRCSSQSNMLSSFMRNFFVFSNVRASGKRTFEKALIHVPFPLIRLYYGVYKSLSSI